MSCISVAGSCVCLLLCLYRICFMVLVFVEFVCYMFMCSISFVVDCYSVVLCLGRHFMT